MVDGSVCAALDVIPQESAFADMLPERPNVKSKSLRDDAFPTLS
jgi:hypothetical protein